MEFTKHKITEAVCAFRFNPSQNPWDITFFSRFYDLIKDHGYNKKAEMKPFIVDFQFKIGEAPNAPNLQQGETQMVFKTDDEKYAILLGNNYISFHTLNHYPGWDVFKPQVIDKSLKLYFDLELGRGLENAQMIYINTFDLEPNKSLSDYLTFVPNMKDFGEGVEISHSYQSNYSIAPNKQLSLKTFFVSAGLINAKKVVLECNCVATKHDDKGWVDLADEAHAAARNAFIKISSNYFKSLIK